MLLNELAHIRSYLKQFMDPDPKHAQKHYMKDLTNPHHCQKHFR